MPNLILRASGIEPSHGKPYSLQIRWHESVGEVEYKTLCRVSRGLADELMRTGVVTWQGPQPWEPCDP